MPTLAPFHDLLDSLAVAFVSTIGSRGEPQVTPMWFLRDGDRVLISLVEDRQKLRNLRRDPRIAVVVVDPAHPTTYVELRGRIGELRRDPELELERRIAEKYAGEHVDIEPPGTVRFATEIVVEKLTSQRF
ncbi:PPOX class F420-dependent oxidoreductase [Pseudonocardia sp. GCM10023141]|uniref:PPOX class F420-dependent oxidoreductase n=1 Tax=Pseudonocardia sp. GCM10023141 TaxID=3252653 RepID=UPI003617DD03